MRRRSSAERGGMVEGRQPFGIRGAGMKGFAHELVDNGQPQRARGRRWRRRVLLEPSPSYHPRPLHIGTCGQANWHVRAAADSLGLTAAENGGDESGARSPGAPAATTRPGAIATHPSHCSTLGRHVVLAMIAIMRAVRPQRPLEERLVRAWRQDPAKRPCSLPLGARRSSLVARHGGQ